MLDNLIKGFLFGFGGMMGILLSIWLFGVVIQAINDYKENQRIDEEFKRYHKHHDGF